MAEEKSLVFTDRTTKLHFNGVTLFTLASAALVGLTLLNILGSCLCSISCEGFLPTISFIGTMVTHDKVLVATCTLNFIIGQALAVSVLTQTRRSLTTFEAVLVWGIMTLFTSFCLLASLVDEANGFCSNPYPGYHVFYSFAALVVGMSWLYLCLDVLSDSSLNSRQGLRKPQMLVKLLGGAGTLTLLEWMFAPSIHHSIFINSNIEALCEWTLLVLASATPAILASVLSDLRVTLSLECIGSRGR
jgi:hypothetical protein